MTGNVPVALWAALAVVLVALVVGALLWGDGSDAGPAGDVADEQRFGASLADPVPYDGRSPALPAGRLERVVVELPRPALADLEDVSTMRPAEQRAYVASLEAEAGALLSALEARGIRTRDVVTYERAWHGFAASVAARDVPGLQSRGVRLRANRRFYPAFSQPVPVRRLGRPAAPPAEATAGADGAGAPSVALLAGGVRDAERGYDAVYGDRDPAPEAAEAGGEPLAQELTRLGVTARVIRVSALRPASGLAAPEEFARTDELLDALEHVVDPDYDGDTSDHDDVALIGVNAPYAGFAQSPEVQAVAGAQRLGTLVVAPSGHEGPGTAALGTIGSPGAARSAVTVGPLSDSRAVARTTLTVGRVKVEGAAVLAGAPPRTELPAAAPVDGAAFGGADAPELSGRVAVVRVGANPGAEAAAAAAAGAAAVLLIEPRRGRPLPGIPVGRVAVPVLGVTGDAAQAVLELDPGAPVSAGRAQVRDVGVPGRPSIFASRGPAFDGTAKPELARPATTVVGGRLIAGAAVAAAAVAADAAGFDDGDPRTARRRLLDAVDAVPGAGRDMPPAPDVQVGTPRIRRAARSTGVAFTVGKFERGDPAAGRPTRIVPAATLELTVEREGGGPVERLTPPGGERGVLPGEYAYTLPRAVLEDLGAGVYRFRVRARAPRQRRATVVTSARFEVG